MWGRFDDTIPLLYLAELMCDALADENEDGPATQHLNDQLVVLYRTIIYERGVRALHTNDPEGALLNMEKFNQLVRDSYQDKSRGTDQTLGVSWTSSATPISRTTTASKRKIVFSNLNGPWKPWTAQHE
jgi:hypothetical protein